MMYRRLAVIFFSFLFIFSLALPEHIIAQTNNIAGLWRGTLTQPGTSFPFQLTIVQEGTTLRGTSRITNDGSFGVMSFTGTINEQTINIEETEIIEEISPPRSRWCIKSLTLTLDSSGSVLEGDWNDPGCNSGTVRLERVGVNVNDPRFNEQWGLTSIQALDAWSITQGVNTTTIAVLDSGVELNHPDLDQKVNREQDYDFYNNDTDTSDDNGHGTHVAGIAAAETNNGTGIAGVCPQCAILPVKVFGSTGQGSRGVADAIRYATDQGADIINMSFGGSVCLPEQAEAINYAYDQGVVLISSSGNTVDDSNSSTCPVLVSFNRINFDVGYPARFERVIAVGASTPEDTRAPFSHYDSTLDIVAPGVDILSTYPTGDYKRLPGTSMASPMVAGVAGLMLSRNAALSPAEVAAILQVSADDIGSPGFDEETGWGRLNAQRALSTTVDTFDELPAAQCPSVAEESTLEDTTPSQTDDLITLYRDLRDDVLLQSEVGQDYLGIYFQQEPALAGILLTNPELRTRTAAFLENASDEFGALLPGSTDSAVLDQALYDEAEALFRDLAAAGSDSFATDVTQIWQELDLQQRVGDDVNDIWQDIQTSQNSVYLPLIQR
jgi:hypothetical protein